MDAQSLSSLTARCLDSFESLDSVLIANSTTADGHISKQDVLDELGRFRVWAGNIGALQKGTISLNHRLRAAQHVFDQVARILQDLAKSLEQLIDIISGDRPPKASDGLSDVSFDELSDDGEDETLSASEPMSEVHELFATVGESITDLLKLSMAIEKASSGDSFARSLRQPAWDDTFDVSHVLQKHSKLEQNQLLAKKLGKAVTRRRQYFNYRNMRRQKMSKEVKWDDGTEQSKSEHTKATTFIAPGPIDLQLLGDNESDSGFSMTTYTAVGEEVKGALKVPLPPPESVDEMPFECPFCFNIIMIKGPTSWKRHVYRDLRPYTCTFLDCDATLFPSRHEWFEHELSEHREKRECCFCSSVCQSKQALVRHLEDSHSGQFTKPQLSTVISTCRRIPSAIPSDACPLCDLPAKGLPDKLSSKHTLPLGDTLSMSQKKFSTHLARHLEQLALFALPKLDTGADDQVSASMGSASNVEAQSDNSQDGLDHSVSEAMMPVYLQLTTLKRCLLEVMASGGVSSERELYPYSVKLNSIDNMRENGLFVINGIPFKDQAGVINLLSECFELADAIRTEAEARGNDINSVDNDGQRGLGMEAATKATPSGNRPEPYGSGDDGVHLSGNAFKKWLNEGSRSDWSFEKKGWSTIRTPTPTLPENNRDATDEPSAADSKDTLHKIPENARWTKIDKNVVSPEALIKAGEPFEERPDCVIVLRVLTKTEIEAFETLTGLLRVLEWPRGVKSDVS